jgi:hypothetical protein
VIWAASGAGYFWPLWPILGVLWFTAPFGHRHRARAVRRRGLQAPAPGTGPGRLDV